MEKKFDFKKFLSNNAIIILIILLALFVGCTTQNFFTETNGKNLLLNVAPRFIIACGVSGCLITKGTDLSAGRQVGLAACFSAMLLQSVDYSARMLPWLPDIPWPVALLIVMAIMACFGAINGCIIAFLKVPPFIATLGMQTIVYGLCSVITNNQPMGGYKQSYLTVASGTLGPIPFLAIFALIVGIFFWFLYNKTRHGKYMYAIGGNENAAQVAGVNVTASLIRIYILASCMYALGWRRGFLAGFSFLGFGGFAAFGGFFWFSFGISCSGGSKPFTSVCALIGAWLCTGWAAGCSGFVRLILMGDS